MGEVIQRKRKVNKVNKMVTRGIVIREKRGSHIGKNKDLYEKILEQESLATLVLESAKAIRANVLGSLQSKDNGPDVGCTHLLDNLCPKEFRARGSNNEIQSVSDIEKEVYFSDEPPD